ncbi:MAG: molybdenum cofactor guanylyltransferase [Planctomycetes bacterium]|nr:molybdenum cofactor guanylyltransferase [Planctomycetota bacterium]
MTPMKEDLACGILAGGLGTRLGGREKAMFRIHGRPLLEYMLRRLVPAFKTVVLSTNRPDRYAWTGLPCVADRLAARCPLSGLHRVLEAIREPRALVIACDMPGVSLSLASRLARVEADVALPVSPSGDEPLHAVYSKACVPLIERAVAEGRLKMTDFLSEARVVRVEIDPAAWTEGPVPPFFNLNTPADVRFFESVTNNSQNLS